MVEFTIPPVLLVQFIVATVLPVLVGLVTTKVTKSGMKAILLATLALVTSLLTELGNAWAKGEAYDFGLGLLMFAGTWAVAVSTHYGILKPTGVSAKLVEAGRTAAPRPIAK